MTGKYKGIFEVFTDSYKCMCGWMDYIIIYSLED